MSLFSWFAAGIPEVHNLYYIPVNPVNKFVQSVHNDTSILNWRICKKRLYRPQIWISRKKSFRTIGFFEEFRAAFRTIFGLYVTDDLVEPFCRFGMPNYTHIASAYCNLFSSNCLSISSISLGSTPNSLNRSRKRSSLVT